MRPARNRGGGYPMLVFLTFIAGTMTGWCLRSGPPRPVTSDSAAMPAEARPRPEAAEDVASASQPAPAPARTSGQADSSGTQPAERAIEELIRRNLRLPIDRADIERWKGMFAEGRKVNSQHEAVDILAPRNTPVHAVEDGTIAKLFYSKAGGNTVYEFDPGQRFCYYYAHLERYAQGLETGQHVSRGDVIGYVGTSGNAPAETPHLHFAVFELDSNRHWWQGRPLDPYLVFQRAEQ